MTGAWRRVRGRGSGFIWTAAVSALVVTLFAVSPAGAAPRSPSASVMSGLGVGRAALGAGLSAVVVDPAAVVGLSDPGVELTAPVDGRLRGDGVALVVTGAALSDRAGSGHQAVSAPSGHHLVVFGFRQVPQPDDPNASGGVAGVGGGGGPAQY